jgi:ribosomal-protein-alanine N-acetyltransferase
MNEIRLRTPRLDLIAATLAHVEAELDTPSRLGSLLGAEVPDGWPPGEYDRDAQEFFRDRLQSGGDEVAGWYGWYAVRRSDARVIGAGGFMGPPTLEGEVEIGYSLLPEARGQGFATELVRALLEHALTHPEVRRVVAHTAEGNEASAAVLTRAGFSPAGPGAEPGQLRFEILSGA